MILCLCQDEIWSEVVLKRVKSMRENTKEGCFGNVPYSFATAAVRSREEVSFCFSFVTKRSAWTTFRKKCITCFFANLPVLHQFRCNTLAGPIVYNIVFDVIHFKGQ